MFARDIFISGVMNIRREIQFLACNAMKKPENYESTYSGENNSHAAANFQTDAYYLHNYILLGKLNTRSIIVSILTTTLNNFFKN